ncbi:MAG: hypothetical protein K8S97_12805 [Anaerolineae bacterium]|nr:hypothetical protein [Anaerolineae bacterium]
MLSHEDVQRLVTLLDQMLADNTAVAYYKQIDAERDATRGDIVALINDFVQHHIDGEAFRAEFDQKTRTDWDTYGFKGLSGAMFLNMLLKHVPDTAELTEQLRDAVCLPVSVNAGREQMQVFQGYLEELIETRIVNRRQIQPGRLPFFLSACWHVQRPDIWPVYYQTGRVTLEAENLYTPLADPTASYFAFWDVYVEIVEALAISLSDLEHFWAWYQRRDVESEKLDEPEVTPEIESEIQADVTVDDARNESTHTHAQLLLAQLGKALGCQIWIASNDHNRTWDGERLGDYSIEQLPSFGGIGPRGQKTIGLIDVLWLRGRQIMAAFEVEKTTSIYSGLLRMSDLTVALVNLAFPLYVVVPESKLDKVKSELERATFQQLELHTRCGFFSYEKLIEEAPGIQKWANEPNIIRRLAQWADDVDFD